MARFSARLFLRHFALEFLGRGCYHPRTLFKRVAKVAVILAVILSVGLHWALLQSVAWTGMFVSFAQQTTLREAFTKTFDGKNPCRICKLVREGQKSETEQASLLPLVKIESLPCATAPKPRSPARWKWPMAKPMSPGKSTAAPRP